MISERKRIGRSCIEVPPIVFGGNVFGWSADEATSFALLDALMERGFNCVDTADIYSMWVEGHQGGESETIIGKWLKARGRREQVLILTKCGWPDTPGGGNLTAAHIVQSVEGSLRRLQTDYIDLYQAHFDDKVTPPEETLKAFQRLIEQGKVRAIGASNYSPDRLRQALETSEQQALPRYECLQPLYNLYDRKAFEGELESLCQQHGLGVISYFSLASGFLTGKYRSEADLGKSAARGQAVRDYLNPRGLRILAALDQVAARYEAVPAQIALAWLIARPTITAPITSATTLAQLDVMFGAAEIALDDEAIRQLDEASAFDAA